MSSNGVDKAARPLRVINATAPIRVCDNGGWTDTWFAEHGKVFNIGVSPFVEVQITVYPRESRAHHVTIHAENYDERCIVKPGEIGAGRHRLLEAVIAEVLPPNDLALDINIHSEIPAGASTGTSASVTVALIAALDALTPGSLTPQEVARKAHNVEVKRLGLQSGIQDQLCAAYGGVNFINMTSYPESSVEQLELPDNVVWELENRLLLVFLGKTHNSSTVHEWVIKELEREGASSERLESLRVTAQLSYEAVCKGDIAALGKAMIENTLNQQKLHDALVNKEAWEIIEIAKSHSAIGWKVNGAGGDGGSLTLLCGPSARDRRKLIKAIRQANSLYTPIPIKLSRHGVRVWDAIH